MLHNKPIFKKWCLIVFFLSFLLLFFFIFEYLNNRHLFLTALEMRSTKSKCRHGRLNPEVSLLDLQASTTSRIYGSAGVHSSRLYSGRQLGFRLWIGWIYFRLWVGFGEGDGTQLQYSCLENPMDGRAW